MKHIHGKRYARGLGKTLSFFIATLAIVSNSAAFSVSLLLPQKAAAVEANCLETPFENNANQLVTTCITVVDCQVVGISASKGLSNVIVVYSDGTYAKYENFDEDQKTWDVPQQSGKFIVGLWIHAGNNHFASDPDPAQYNNGNSVGRYHQVAAPTNCNVEVEENCSVSIFSDMTNTVAEKGNANAQALSFIHSQWTANIDGATWIWGDNPVADPTNETIQTFSKVFGWSGPVDSAVIDIAADNDYILWINGTQVGTGSNTFGGAQQHNIAANILTGNNTIKVEVKNWQWPTVDAQTNPAGLLYKAVVTSTNEEGCTPPEEQTPSVNVLATKIVCDQESDLPNWGGGGQDISASTASQWLSDNANKGCYQPETWDYQYRLSDEATYDGSYGPIAGWTTFSNSANVTLSGNTTIQLREVLPESYLPFAGWTTDQGNGSAEFYCHTDVLNYDNWEWIQSPQNGATYSCVAFNVKKPAVLNATKIVCDSEEYLPNWGDGSHGPITATTASDFLTSVNQGHDEPVCRLMPWEFQWKASQSDDPADQAIDAGAGWNTFGSSALVWVDAGSQISVREKFNDNYIPFTGQNTTENVSAEIYCNDDALHYDNWEWINVQSDQTYYCVAWNVLDSVGRVEGLVYNDQNNNSSQEITEPGMEGWTVWLLTHNSPFKLHAITSTDAEGDFVFEHLNLTSNYYVCQDVQSGWFQTQLNLAGLSGINIDSAIVGEVLGDSDALHDLINEFCYPVTLSLENPSAENKDFGNFQTQSRGVLGTSTDTPNDPSGEGQVLAESTLSNTGENISLIMAIGLIIISLAALLTYRSRKQSSH